MTTEYTKPKTEEELAIDAAFEAVKESRDWGRTVTLGAAIMYGAGLISTIVLPEESPGFFIFLGFGGLLFLYSTLVIDRKTWRLKREAMKLLNSYKRRHAVPLFNRVTEALPDMHVHLDDDGTIVIRQTGKGKTDE